MEEVATLVLTTLLTAVIAGGVSFAYWKRKKDLNDLQKLISRLEKMDKELEKLKVKAVSDPEVRAIVSEEVIALKEEISYIKGAVVDLTSLISNLRVDLGVLNYIKDRESESDDKR